METFMNGAMVVEAALISFLLALWVAWMLLSGLFRLMPKAARSSQPMRLVSNRQQANGRRDAA